MGAGTAVRICNSIIIQPRLSVSSPTLENHGKGYVISPTLHTGVGFAILSSRDWAGKATAKIKL